MNNYLDGIKEWHRNRAPKDYSEREKDLYAELKLKEFVADVFKASSLHLLMERKKELLDK